MWNIIFGDPKTPKTGWRVEEYDITDPKEGDERVKSLNSYRRERRATYEKGGQYYSEMRDGVKYYNVMITPERKEYSYETGGYNTTPAVWEMMTEEEARWSAPYRFYEYYYDAPSDLSWVYSLRKVTKEEDYLAREAARTDNPILLPPEIAPDTSQFGYPYLCANLIPPNMVSFYASREDAWANKRTQMKLGRFLRKFVGHNLDDNMIADACARVGVQYETDVKMHMARTRDEFREAYINGPDSCMAYSSLIIGGVHPVEAYAAGDLALAYLERDGEITARTLVHPGKMKYLGIYGDNIRLSAMLEKLGYRQSGRAIGGAKMLKIPVEGREDQYFLPYLDGKCRQVMDMGDHFIVYEEPRRFTGDTSGRIHIDD